MLSSRTPWMRAVCALMMFSMMTGLGAQVPGWKPPFTILPAPTDTKPILDRLNGKETAIWVENDVLTVAHREESEGGLSITGGIQQPMSPIPGTDAWVIQLRMPDWDKTFFTYAFIPAKLKPGMRFTLQKWYGEHAPTPPERAKPLKGTLIERTLHSDSLNEDRKLTIYLPPDAPKQGLPAFFLADGQSCKTHAEVLEPLILAKKVRPCAIIGIHSAMPRPEGPRPGEDRDRRAAEYLKRYEPATFDKHMVFFVKEVPAYVAREFGISEKRDDHAVMGFSNGGGFAFDAAYEHPEVFGHSLPFSASHGLRKNETKPAGEIPKFHFAAGELEYFNLGTKQFYEEVQKWPASATIDLYKAGHDPEMWEMAFGRIAPSVFPYQRVGAPTEQGL